MMKTEKTKIAVLVSGGGTNLQALLDAEQSGILQNGEIVLVFSSNPHAFALERGKKAGVPVAFTKKGLSQEEFEDQLSLALELSGAELIVLAGFMKILSEHFIKKYKNRIVNVHPSLIPSFCGKGFYGLKVHEAALRYGVKVTGATVHLVNEIPDGGKILLQKAVEIQENDTPELLQKRVMEEAEWILLPKAVEQLSKELRNEKEQA